MIYCAAHILQLCWMFWWRLTNSGFIMFNIWKFELVCDDTECFLFTMILKCVEKIEKCPIGFRCTLSSGLIWAFNTLRKKIWRFKAFKLFFSHVVFPNEASSYILAMLIQKYTVLQTKQLNAKLKCSLFLHDGDVIQKWNCNYIYCMMMGIRDVHTNHMRWQQHSS